MDRGDQQHITVVTETRNLRSQPFTPSENHLSTGKQWEEWLEGLEREFRYFKISESVDKKDALIIYGGKEISRLERSLKNEAADDEYSILKNKLNKHFLPKKNKQHARYTFLKMKQLRGETVGGYITRLRERAYECEFGETMDERILEHCIQSIENKELIRKTISKGWTLERFIEEAAHMEDTCLQLQEMNCGEFSNSGNTVYRIHNENEWKRFQDEARIVRDNDCNYCGMQHREGRCPAYGKECRNCGKLHHYASVCRTGRTQDGFNNQQYRRTGNQTRNGKKVKKTIEKNNYDTDGNYSSEDDEDYFGESIKHISKVGKVKLVNKKSSLNKTVRVQIDDIEMEVEPDSGADVNIMDEHQFNKLFKMSRSKPTLKESRILLSTITNSLPVKGEFRTIIRNTTCGTAAKFIVIKGRINSPPLISKTTLIELGMLRIEPHGAFAKQNELRIQSKRRDMRFEIRQNRIQMKEKKIDSQTKDGLSVVKERLIRNQPTTYPVPEFLPIENPRNRQERTNQEIRDKYDRKSVSVKKIDSRQRQYTSRKRNQAGKRNMQKQKLETDQPTFEDRCKLWAPCKTSAGEGRWKRLWVPCKTGAGEGIGKGYGPRKTGAEGANWSGRQF